MMYFVPHAFLVAPFYLDEGNSRNRIRVSTKEFPWLRSTLNGIFVISRVNTRLIQRFPQFMTIVYDAALFILRYSSFFLKNTFLQLFRFTSGFYFSKGGHMTRFYSLAEMSS